MARPLQLRMLMLELETASLYMCSMSVPSNSAVHVFPGCCFFCLVYSSLIRAGASGSIMACTCRTMSASASATADSMENRCVAREERATK